MNKGKTSAKLTEKASAKMKIKDLPANANLEGVKFHDPKTGTTGYWKSQWHKGVWYTMELGATRVYPLFVSDLKEALEWEVI